MNRSLSVVIILSIIAFSACQSTPRESTLLEDNPVSTTSEPSSTSTLETTTSTSQTPTTDTISTSLPVTPSSLSIQTIGEDFLFGRETQTCMLPCWQRLAIGKSNHQDLNTLFTTVFGFNNAYDIYENNVISSDLPDTTLIYQRWIVEPDESLSFTAYLDMDDVLQAYGFSWISARFGAYITPQTVIKKFGQPLVMMVSIKKTSRPNKGLLRLMIIEEEGMNFVFDYMVDIEQVNPERSVARFCLNQNGESALVRITQPYTERLEEVSPFQESFIQSSIRDYDLLEFEDVFQITKAEVTNRILNESNVCLTKDIQ
jgi:hypothetical protein